MSLSRQDVEKVSLLGRLRLGPAELDTMTAQLAAIVGYVELLSELNTDAVEPMAHALELHNVFKSDEVAASLPVKQALANSPHHDAQFYLVPAVLGE